MAVLLAAERWADPVVIFLSVTICGVIVNKTRVPQRLHTGNVYHCCVCSRKMVDTRPETWNQLLSVLQDWAVILNKKPNTAFNREKLGVAL